MITFQFVPSEVAAAAAQGYPPRITTMYSSFNLSKKGHEDRTWRGKNVNRQNTLGNGDESMNVSCKLEMNITTIVSNPLRAADW